MHITSTASRPRLTELAIINRQLPEVAFPGAGVCHKPRAADAVVNTVVIHSCYVTNELNMAAECKEPSNALLAKAVTEAEAWRAKIALLKGELTVEQRAKLEGEAKEKEFSAIRFFLQSKGVEVQTFSVDAICGIFEFYGVSAHYVIDREGRIFELVAPERVAFHAGPSEMPAAMGGAKGVNAFSIGIELLATETSGFTDLQYSAVSSLANALRARFPTIQYFVGHSDIAPGRKTDPEGFNWSRFAQMLG